MVKATEVPPNQIENELTHIWDSLEKKGKWRASLFNLILYSRKDARSDYVLTLTQKIIEKFPSRVIFVVVDPERDPTYMKTKVSVLSGTDVSEDFACDYIEIVVGEQAEPIVPFLILPQLLADLPVYLVWTQDICQEKQFSQKLEKLAHRLILDSEATENLPCFAKSALKHYQEAQCEIADLNWARMESWRDLTASAFYSEEHLNHLKKTQTLSITYNGRPSPSFCHTQIQAIYLKTWLASRLGWTFQKCKQENSHLAFYYLRDDVPLTITLTPAEHTNLSPGTITAMTIHTSDNIQYTFTRDLASPHQITAEITTTEQCYLPTQYIFAKGEAGGSLVKEVSHKGTSEHYLAVLKSLATMEEL